MDIKELRRILDDKQILTILIGDLEKKKIKIMDINYYIHETNKVNTLRVKVRNKTELDSIKKYLSEKYDRTIKGCEQFKEIIKNYEMPNL